MAVGDKGKFEAGASALGFAYQFRVALNRALDALPHGLDWQIGVEAADDVEYVSDANSERLQLKHRADGTSLSDASVDLWKTLRIWCVGLSDGSLEISTTWLYLMTTATVSGDSAASRLGPENRDISGALAMLRKTAATSTNKELQKAIQAWNALTESEQGALLERVIILGTADRVEEVLDKIRRICSMCVRRVHLDAFVEMLEGWWFQQCLRALAGRRSPYISGEELDGYVSDLRERFLPDNLPIAADIETSGVPDVNAFAERIFVEQLRLTRIGAVRIGDAVRDYLRAFTQRSRWVRQGLLIPGELEEYERRLIEEWRYVFNRLADELSDDALEDQKVAVAKQVYAWVEEASAPPVRAMCTERFLIRGSLHMLADVIRVGWHPDFEARLVSLLEPVTS
ncbi:ABC-three component system protein [Kribbella sp. NPDC051620]|uniref:ABC-three component system protein n=1 Tax=Kribbella sp. NPDC051620 TaxID=3364120 RepID=UPI0037A3C2D7